MKRSLCAALACAFIFISAAVPTQKASAYAVYGRVIEYDVGFYKDPQCTSLLFYLPYSYYVEIAEKTGASTATISRVNRCLHYGTDGYKLAIDRVKAKKEKEDNE